MWRCDKRLFREYWGNGLVMTSRLRNRSSGSYSRNEHRLHKPRSINATTTILVCVSDLVFVKLLDMAAWAFQAFEILSRYAQLNVLISLTRLIGIAALIVLVPHPTVVAWSAVYLAGSVLAAFIGVLWVTFSRLVGPGSRSASHPRGNRGGLSFPPSASPRKQFTTTSTKLWSRAFPRCKPPESMPRPTV